MCGTVANFGFELITEVTQWILCVRAFLHVFYTFFVSHHAYIQISSLHIIKQFHILEKKWHRFNGQEIKMIILTLVLDWIFKKMKFKYLCISILISNWLLFCDLFLTHGILGTLYVCTFRFMHNSNMLMYNWVAFFYLGHFNFAFIIYLYNNFFFFLYF